MTYHITPKGDAAQCKATKGRCPFGEESEHFGSQAAAVKAFEAKNSGETIPQTIRPVSPTMLINASYETGFAARSYFRLLNHQNYDQAKELYGKVKDQEVIDAVKESHRAAQSMVDLEYQQKKNYSRLRDSQTLDQRRGYIETADRVTMRLTQASADLDASTVKIDALKAKYAKELAIHNNSLKAMERLAASDKPIARPGGIERRIAELRVTKKALKPIAPITKILGDGNPDQTAEAARAYGKPYYTQSAENLRVASVEKEVLEGERARLDKLSQGTANAAVKATVVAEVAKADYKLVGLVSTIRANQPRVALFRDEVRDRALHESDMSRELAALIKIETRTRQ